jgi:hypothetical protein
MNGVQSTRCALMPGATPPPLTTDGVQHIQHATTQLDAPRQLLQMDVAQIMLHAPTRVVATPPLLQTDAVQIILHAPTRVFAPLPPLQTDAVQVILHAPTQVVAPKMQSMKECALITRLQKCHQWNAHQIGEHTPALTLEDGAGFECTIAVPPRPR